MAGKFTLWPWRQLCVVNFWLKIAVKIMRKVWQRFGGVLFYSIQALKKSFREFTFF